MGLSCKFNWSERIEHMGQTLKTGSGIFSHGMIINFRFIGGFSYEFAGYLIKSDDPGFLIVLQDNVIIIINYIYFIMGRLVNYFTYPLLNVATYPLALNEPLIDINNIKGGSCMRADRLIALFIAVGSSGSRFFSIPNCRPIKPNHLEREEEAYA